MAAVLHVDTYSGHGGGQRVMCDLVSALSDRGEKAVVFLPSGYYYSLFVSEGIPTFRAPVRFGVSWCISFWRTIKTVRPDIIHCHGTRAAVFVRFLCFFMRRRPLIVYTLHGVHIIRRAGIIRFISVNIDRLLNRITDVVVCVSHSDKRIVLNERLMSAARVRVVPNGVRVADYSCSAPPFKKNSKLRVLSIGRLHQPKDQKTVIRAVEHYARKCGDITLDIVGDGSLREELECYVHTLQATNAVTFLGFRNDIPTLLCDADIVVLSSRWEGLPIVALESFAAGRLFVGSDVDGINEIIIDGETGRLFPFGDDKALCDIFLDIKRNPDQAIKIVKRAQCIVEEKYTVTAMVAAYIELYEDLTSK